MSIYIQMKILKDIDDEESFQLELQQAQRNWKQRLDLATLGVHVAPYHTASGRCQGNVARAGLTFSDNSLLFAG